MPAIPSFINNYKPGWNAKAVFKSSLSRFNHRSETLSSGTSSHFPVIDIKDDQSSLDFDGGQPDEYEHDLVDNTPFPRSPRPSNVSSSPPAKLEISLPPELRIDWFAEKFDQAPSSNVPEPKADTNVVDFLDQEARDMLAGKLLVDERMVESLEDVMSRHVDSNPARVITISGLDLQIPGISPTKDALGPLTIQNDHIDLELRKPPPRDSLTMLTSIGDPPVSSALSGTTLARALISNTFAMPVGRLSEVGPTRIDSIQDPSAQHMFSKARDAPPMPLDAETQYVAPKRPRSERRIQMQRRSSTGTLSSKALPDLPNSRRTSLHLSTGSEYDTLFRSSGPLSPDAVLIPGIIIPKSPQAETAKSATNSLTLPPLPDGVRRLPDPRSPSTTSGNSLMSPKSSTSSKDQGLEDVLEYYNPSQSSAPLLAGASFRPGFRPIREETSSQLSPAILTPLRNVPPIGARIQRGRADSMPMSKRPLIPFAAQNDSSSRLSDISASLQVSQSLEQQPSDDHATRKPSIERTPSIPGPTTSLGVEASSSGGDVRRSGEDSRRNVEEEAVSANNNDGSHVVDAPMMSLNNHPTLPTDLNQSTLPHHIETHAQDYTPSQTGDVVAFSTSNISVSSLPGSNSHPTDSPPLAAPLADSNGSSSSHVWAGANGSMTVEENGHPAASDPLMQPHHRAYKDDYLARLSTFSMGAPPPYSEVANHSQIPSTHNSAYGGAFISDSGPGPSRLSGEWNINDSTRSNPGRARVRPRPPLPIGPRRPTPGMLPSGITLPMSRDRSGSLTSMTTQPSISRLRSGRLTSIPSPSFETPPPKWRGHTMDDARWTFQSTQLQAIVSHAIKQTSEASLIRLLEPEILERDLPAEVTNLETLRTDIKSRYKLLARRRAALFEALSSFLSGNTEEGSSCAHRLLEELSDIAASMDHLSEELHSTDTQLAHLDSLIQVHKSSALAVALRKLNTSLIKQMADNESLRNELSLIETERDEAWRQAEHIAFELDQLATNVEDPSPIVSNRSSKIYAHRKSLALASKAGLKVIPSSGSSRPRFSKHLSLAVTPSSGGGGGGGINSALASSSYVSPVVGGSSSKGHHLRTTSVRKRPVLNMSESAALLTPPVVTTSGYTPSTELLQVQDELYAMLGLRAPSSSLRRSQSWKGLSSSTSPHSETVSQRHSVFLTDHYNNNDSHRSSAGPATRRTSLPPDSTLAQVSNAMAADRNAMLFTFDILSAEDNQVNPLK